MKVVFKSVSLVFFIFIIVQTARCQTEGLQPVVNPDCPRPIFWSGIGFPDRDWSDAANWENYEDEPLNETPQPFHQVFLDAGNSSVVDQTITISSIRISSTHKLVIKPTSKLILENVELHCWGVNWCYNHGKCVNINECECDPGYSGTDCSIEQCSPADTPKNPCGICENELGSSTDICQCSNYLGEDSTNVDRLLLIDTNNHLIDGINEVLAQIALLKQIVADYDPSSLILQNELPQYITFLQQVNEGNLGPFLLDNLNFLTLLQEAISDKRMIGKS